MTKAQLRTRSYRRSALALLAGFLILLGLMSGGIISNQYRGVLISVFIYILLATSLNLTTGALGELVLGHAGFMSIGEAYELIKKEYIDLAPVYLHRAQRLQHLHLARACDECHVGSSLFLDCCIDMIPAHGRCLRPKLDFVLADSDPHRSLLSRTALWQHY